MSNMIDMETLSNIMNQHIQLLGKLDATLTEEYVILEKNQFGQLEQITQLKLSLLNELQQAEIALYTFLNKPDTERPASLKLIFEDLGLNSSPILSGLQEKLTDLTQKCSDQNKINGMLIHSKRRISQHMVQLLQNQVPGGAASTYGRNGETNTLSFSATNVEA